MKKIGLLFFTFLAYLSAKPVISVSIPPQAYFLKQIAGDSLEINVLIPQESDPHAFEFKPQTLLKLQKSDLYLTMGLEFEEIWLPKLRDNLPNTKILPITDKIPFLQSHSLEVKYEHHDKHHHHDEHDPHIWLSPPLVKILAQNIATILIQHYPKHAELYKTNLAHFLTQIESLHQNILSKLHTLKKRSFLSYHPAWGYFAQSYQLRELSIETEGKEPTPQSLKHILESAQKEKIGIIFVPNQSLIQNAKALTKMLKAKIWIANPLAYEWEKELLHFTQGLLEE